MSVQLAERCDICEREFLPGEEEMVPLEHDGKQGTVCKPCLQKAFQEVFSGSSTN